jgi:hypothetical protein
MKNPLLIATLASLAVVLAFASPFAGADTIRNATIVRVSAYSAPNLSHIYFRMGGLDNTYNSCTTEDINLVSAAMHAMRGPANVEIVTTDFCNLDTNSKCGTCEVVRINP